MRTVVIMVVLRESCAMTEVTLQEWQGLQQDDKLVILTEAVFTFYRKIV